MARPRRQRSGWRGLGLYWAVVLTGTAALLGTLQYLGPPQPTEPLVSSQIVPSEPSTPKFGDVAVPLGAMLEGSRAFPGGMLPKIGSNGRVSRRVYARATEATGKRPRIAVLITGIGSSAAESHAAMETLPGPISLAFTPYGGNTDALQAFSRQTGHEMLISIPMEPQGFPLNDAGSHSLLTGATPAMNATNLDWALSRIQGYVGAVGALDAMRGERFAEQTSNLKAVLDELKRRGLLYVDPRPGKASELVAQVPGRSVDLVLDDPPARAEIEAKLAGLERIAREKGSALGLAGPLRPVPIDRITAWAKTLADRGIDLVPVSALTTAEPPAATPPPSPSTPSPDRVSSDPASSEKEAIAHGDPPR